MRHVKYAAHRGKLRQRVATSGSTGLIDARSAELSATRVSIRLQHAARGKQRSDGRTASARADARRVATAGLLPARAVHGRLRRRGLHPATGLEQNPASSVRAGVQRRRRATRRSSRNCWSGRGRGGAGGDGAGGASGFTPLHYAARNGHAGRVALLLRHRAAVAATSGGATALHRAAFCGHEAIVRALLAARACATLQDADGEALLHKAAAREPRRWRGCSTRRRRRRRLRDRRGRTPAERVPVAAWGWLEEARRRWL